MKIIHAPVTRNKRIRALPVTGNYLVKDSGGMYRWAETNDRWRLFSPTGGSKCLIANMRRDDTEHSPDLWLYSNLTQKEIEQMGTDTDFLPELLKANRDSLDRTRRWYVRQFIASRERMGIQRFTGIPLKAFWDMWRVNIDTTDIQIYGLSNGQMKILYKDYNFNVYLDWPVMQRDMQESKSSINQTNTKWIVSEKVMPWLHKYCERGFIPFADYDLMFQDPEDEFSYIADVA